MINKIKLRRKRRRIRKIKRKLSYSINKLGVIPSITINEVCRLYGISLDLKSKDKW